MFAAVVDLDPPVTLDGEPLLAWKKGIPDAVLRTAGAWAAKIVGPPLRAAIHWLHRSHGLHRFHRFHACLLDVGGIRTPGQSYGFLIAVHCPALDLIEHGLGVAAKSRVRIGSPGSVHDRARGIRRKTLRFSWPPWGPAVVYTPRQSAREVVRPSGRPA